MKAVSLLVLVCALICGATGCGNSSPSLVGKWEQKEVADGRTPVTLEFTVNEMSYPIKGSVVKLGKYKFIDVNTIEVDLTESTKQTIKSYKEAIEELQKTAAEIHQKKYEPKSTIVGDAMRFKVSITNDELTINELSEKPGVFKRVK